MKKFIPGAILLSFALLSGCITEEGPQGPPGPVGPQGPAGVDAENAYVFEYENINFTAPDYDAILSYPDDFEGLASDVALAYLLWGVENVDGEDLEIWRPLPQTVLTEFGTLIYNYDFTLNDVRIFLDADFSLDQLGAIDTDDWVARVVVVPGDFWASGRIDSTIGYYELIEMLDIQHKETTGGIIQRR